jgi:hypothetical protein
MQQTFIDPHPAYPNDLFLFNPAAFNAFTAWLARVLYFPLSHQERSAHVPDVVGRSGGSVALTVLH